MCSTGAHESRSKEKDWTDFSYHVMQLTGRESFYIMCEDREIQVTREAVLILVAKSWSYFDAFSTY